MSKSTKIAYGHLSEIRPDSPSPRKPASTQDESEFDTSPKLLPLVLQVLVRFLRRNASCLSLFFLLSFLIPLSLYISLSPEI